MSEFEISMFARCATPMADVLSVHRQDGVWLLVLSDWLSGERFLHKCSSSYLPVVGDTVRLKCISNESSDYYSLIEAYRSSHGRDFILVK